MQLLLLCITNTAKLDALVIKMYKILKLPTYLPHTVMKKNINLLLEINTYLCTFIGSILTVLYEINYQCS